MTYANDTRKQNRAHRTKRVRTRSMYENVQGDSVKLLEAADLPAGCSNLVTSAKSTFPYPCTKRMTFIGVKFERRWMPVVQEYELVAKVMGYCRVHRPRIVVGDLLELPDEVAKQVNGSKTQKARIRKMEDALYTEVVPGGGTTRHSVQREDIGMLGRGFEGFLRQPIDTLCGLTLKSAYMPTAKEARSEYPKQCPKCLKAREVVE